MAAVGRALEEQLRWLPEQRSSLLLRAERYLLTWPVLTWPALTIVQWHGGC